MLTRQNHRAHAPAALPDDVGQLDQLVKIYGEALEELRSWRDPGVASLIATLQALQLRASGQLRYLKEAARFAARL